MSKRSGRPTKLTAEVHAAIERALRLGALLGDAARLTGVDVVTVRRWMERGRAESQGPYREFCTMVSKTRAETKVRCVGGILLAGQNDWRAFQYYLSVTDPTHYALPTRAAHRVELSGAQGAPLAISIDLSGADKP